MLTANTEIVNLETRNKWMDWRGERVARGRLEEQWMRGLAAHDASVYGLAGP